jgi:2-polyprenyl-6-methoxyphenol hydroxylase-like FAD-dependent oxidoreductase
MLALGLAERGLRIALVDSGPKDPLANWAGLLGWSSLDSLDRLGAGRAALGEPALGVLARDRLGGRGPGASDELALGVGTQPRAR